MACPVRHFFAFCLFNRDPHPTRPARIGRVKPCDNVPMSHTRRKPKPGAHATDTASTAAPAPTTPPAATTQPQPPADQAAPLSLDEEEAYSLLVDFANTRKAEQGERRQPQKTRVEFAQLVTRAQAVRFLLSYFAGALPSVAMREAGIGWGDLTICRLASPDFDAAFKFCKASTGERLALKALEATEKALDGRDIGKEAASLSKFLLERLAADTYGDPRYKHGGGGQHSGGGNTYNINIIQAAAAPAMCGGRVAGIPQNAKSEEMAAIDV